MGKRILRYTNELSQRAGSLAGGRTERMDGEGRGGWVLLRYTLFRDYIPQVTPSWMVSVLKEEEVGADDASSGNSEKPISPRMMNRKEGGIASLPADDRGDKET